LRKRAVNQIRGVSAAAPMTGGAKGKNAQRRKGRSNCGFFDSIGH
jgi:hypothetical protein